MSILRVAGGASGEVAGGEARNNCLAHEVKTGHLNIKQSQLGYDKCSPSKQSPDRVFVACTLLGPPPRSGKHDDIDGSEFRNSY